MRLRFNLKTLFVALTLTAVACAVIMPWIIERRMIANVASPGVQIYTEARGYYLLRQFVGDRIAQRAVYIHLDDARVDDSWLKNLGGFSQVEVLSIRSEKVSDVGLHYLDRLPNLRSLHLYNTKVTADGIAELKKSIPRLRFVERRNDAE